MQGNEVDPLIKRAVADAVLGRATLELRKLLQELAGSLVPFPKFMGVSSIEAVEVEPHTASNPENGSIVVCPDGELRELILRMIPGPFDAGGVDQLEEMAEPDMTPGEYVAYAHAAVHQLSRIFEERQQSEE